MFPYDFETASIWEADNWRERPSDGVLELFQPERAFKAVRASNTAVYPGVRLDRTVVVTPRYVLDVFRVSPSAPPVRLGLALPGEGGPGTWRRKGHRGEAGRCPRLPAHDRGAAGRRGRPVVARERAVRPGDDQRACRRARRRGAGHRRRPPLAQHTMLGVRPEDRNGPERRRCWCAAGGKDGAVCPLWQVDPTKSGCAAIQEVQGTAASDVGVIVVVVRRRRFGMRTMDMPLSKRSRVGLRTLRR